MIESIAALSSLNSSTDIQALSTQPYQQANGASFSDLVASEVSVINDQINSAELGLREFAAGKTDNLHQVMLGLNKARLSFELMVEVRNKTLEGYQQIMRMQI